MRGVPAPALPGAPISLTRFFGRESESDEVAQRLRHARLVTVVGAPGAGKTRLAVEVAQRAGESFADGMRPVALAVVASSDDLAGEVAATLGVTNEDDADIEEVLVAELRSQEVLVLLDNCEHVVDRAAALVGRILTHCPGVTVLATSRVPLAVPGEQLFRIPSLGRHSAVDLFVDRARLVTDLVLDDVAREHVGRICARLDDLPLAIELAARQARAFSLEEIRTRLGAELADVTIPGSAPGHRRTMAATIGWSCGLLTPEQNRLFEDLSVLLGRFDLRAVEAVGTTYDELPAALAGLVDHSLVLAEPAGSTQMHYRMLEPIRQFAAARLDARGNADEVRARHASHHLEIVRTGAAQLLQTNGCRWREELRRVEGNVLAAAEWAKGVHSDLALQLVTHLADYWRHTGYVNQARARVEALLDHGPPSPRSRAEALVVLGHLGYRQGRYLEAQAHSEEAVATMEALGDDEGTAWALLALGAAASCCSDSTALAVDACERSVRIFDALGDPHAGAWSRIVLGLAHYGAHDMHAGALAQQGALDMLTELDAAGALLSRANIGLSFAAAVKGDTAAHRRHLEAAIAHLRVAGVLAEDYEWLWSAMSLAHDEGRMETAVRLASAARVLSHRGNRPPPVAETVCLEAVADAEVRLGPRVARRHWETGSTMATEDAVEQALAAPAGDSALSARELQVARLTARGLSNADIADQLFISRRTVESHQDRIRSKLHLSNRYEVMAWAVAEGLVEESV